MFVVKEGVIGRGLLVRTQWVRVSGGVERKWRVGHFGVLCLATVIIWVDRREYVY